MPNLNLKKLWRRRSVTISEKDPTYKVIYLGNVLTGWAKGEGCVDKPLSTLWRNYCQSNRTDILMKVTICASGLQAVTREHGLTEYWAHRVTYCGAHAAYPKVFCWVYRHEGRRLKQELRCHAVLLHRGDRAQVMMVQLKDRLTAALHEFRREKVVRQNARLSLVHAIYDSAALPARKILLSTGAANYRPPLERSKSAPKLGSIEEILGEEEEEEEDSPVEDDPEGESQARGKSVVSSPIGSIAISETMSDIVHYNNNTAELSLRLSETPRSASNDSDGKNEDDKEGQNEEGVDESQLLNRASNSSLINSSSSKLIYPPKLAPCLRPPSLRRRFIRSILIDPSFDNDDSDDFDDEDTRNSGADGRVANNLSRNNPLRTSFKRSHDQLTNMEDINGETTEEQEEDPEEELNDEEEEGERTSSLNSTITIDTVLEKPHTTKDHIAPDRQDCAADEIDLMNCLTNSLTRQLSLPSDTTPSTEESLSGVPRRSPTEESLTSDQPESLGSHCDSCGSSCGGCSDNGAEGHPGEELILVGEELMLTDTSESRDRRLLTRLVDVTNIGNLANLSSLNAALATLSQEKEEPDNISEESGYAEEKDFLHNNNELAKTTSS